jgi:hypothetical protein
MSTATPQQEKRLSTYTITAEVEASRITFVQKKLRDAFGLEADQIFTVEKEETNLSRADRLGDAESSMGEAQGIIDELIGEMQNWYDSIPENLQGSQKADDIQECISNLESLLSEIESIDFSTVEFPGMMG